MFHLILFFLLDWSYFHWNIILFSDKYFISIEYLNDISAIEKNDFIWKGYFWMGLGWTDSFVLQLILFSFPYTNEMEGIWMRQAVREITMEIPDLAHGALLGREW